MTKLQAPEFYGIPKPAEQQSQLARPAGQELASNNPLPITIGPDEEIDDALVSTNEMCYSGRGGGGGGAM